MTHHHPTPHPPLLPLLLLLLLLLLLPPTTRTERPPPLTAGSSIIYGSWKAPPLNSTAEQQRWDAASLDSLVRLGAAATGASFNWCNMQPARGAPINFTATDAYVHSARARNLTLYAFTGNTPDWALAPAQHGLGYRFPPLPAFADDFSLFFTALAAHYRPMGLRHYEFWNEQNGCGWTQDGCRNGNRAWEYAPWLCRWYAAMRAGCADCILSVGGLDYNAGVADAYTYIDDLTTANASRCYDAVAIHPYGGNAAGAELNYQALVDTRAAMGRAGDGGQSKELWVNEFGWHGISNQTFKAQLTTRALTALAASPANISLALYLSLTDLPGTPDNATDGWGLASQDTPTFTITPRPAWTAFQAWERSHDQPSHDQ